MNKFLPCILILLGMSIFIAGCSDSYNSFSEGDRYFHQGQYDKAIQSYDQVLKKLPGNALAWQKKGNAYYFWGKYIESIDSYDHVLATSPDDRETLEYKAIVQYKLGKYDEALKTIDIAIDIENKKYPDYPYGTKIKEKMINPSLQNKNTGQGGNTGLFSSKKEVYSDVPTL